MTTTDDQALSLARLEDPLPVLGVFPRTPLRWAPFADRQRRAFAALAAADAAGSPPDSSKSRRLAAMLAALAARAALARRGNAPAFTRGAVILARLTHGFAAPVRVVVGSDYALADITVSVPIDGPDLVVRVLVFT